MDSRPIGVFDSGVGGLSILIELKKLLPSEAFVFLGDQKHVPYGGKTKEELLTLVSRAMDFFIQQDVKAVVLACNTATVYVIDELRQRYTIPIIGTVPVVKQLKNFTKTKKTAVFSTPATAKSPYLKRLADEYADGIEIELVGGSNLEELVEKGNLENSEIVKTLNKILPPLVDKGVDVIALSCTHYPFLKRRIQDIVGSHVTLIDSGEAVARRTRSVLAEHALLSDQEAHDSFFTTGDPEAFKRVAEELLGYDVGVVRRAEYV